KESLHEYPAATAESCRDAGLAESIVSQRGRSYDLSSPPAGPASKTGGARGNEELDSIPEWLACLGCVFFVLVIGVLFILALTQKKEQETPHNTWGCITGMEADGGRFVAGSLRRDVSLGIDSRR